MLPAQRFDAVSRAGELCLGEGWKGGGNPSWVRNERQWHLLESRLMNSAKPKVRT